jgi:Asp-tRNA(Asn)/Glu-tRNA(Gln) amidotransferase B subunit
MALRQRREEAAKRILEEQPDISNARLAQLIAIATRNRISDSTARAIREQLATEGQAEHAAEQRPPLHIITPTSAPAINPINPTREQREN